MIMASMDFKSWHVYRSFAYTTLRGVWWYGCVVLCGGMAMRCNIAIASLAHGTRLRDLTSDLVCVCVCVCVCATPCYITRMHGAGTALVRKKTFLVGSAHRTPPLQHTQHVIRYSLPCLLC